MNLDGKKPEELGSLTEEWNRQVVGEGYVDPGALITAHNETQAALKAAEAARDKFARENDEARTIIQGKGTEIGELTQKIKALEEQAADLARKLEEAKPGAEEPPATTPPPANGGDAGPSLEELKQNLTPEMVAALDAKMKAIDADPNLSDEQKDAFCNGMRTNPEMQKKAILQVTGTEAGVRPTTFLAKPQPPPVDKTKEMTKLFSQYLEQGKVGAPPGPSVGSGGGSNKTTPSGTLQLPDDNWGGRERSKDSRVH